MYIYIINVMLLMCAVVELSAASCGSSPVREPKHVRLLQQRMNRPRPIWFHDQYNYSRLRNLDPVVVEAALRNDIEKGSVVLDAQDKEGNTFLHVAVQCSDNPIMVALAQVFIEKGASLDIRNKRKQTVLDIAKNEKANAEDKIIYYRNDPLHGSSLEAARGKVVLKALASLFGYTSTLQDTPSDDESDEEFPEIGALSACS